jgi:hypothetical protein
MNNSRLIIPLFLLSLLAASCGDGPEATSTPVDSVNLHGTAPIEYKHNDPADTTSSAAERGMDTVTDPGLSNSEPDLKDKQ